MAIHENRAIAKFDMPEVEEITKKTVKIGSMTEAGNGKSPVFPDSIQKYFSLSVDERVLFHNISEDMNKVFGWVRENFERYGY